MLALSPVLVSDFDYELPEELIAQPPPVERGNSRMLVLSRAAKCRTRTMFLPTSAGICDPAIAWFLNNSRASSLPGCMDAGTARMGPRLRSFWYIIQPQF